MTGVPLSFHLWLAVSNRPNNSNNRLCYAGSQEFKAGAGNYFRPLATLSLYLCLASQIIVQRLIQSKEIALRVPIVARGPYVAPPDLKHTQNVNFKFNLFFNRLMKRRRHLWAEAENTTSRSWTGQR